MKQLDLKDCTTNEEVCMAVAERMTLVSHEELQLAVSKHFVYQEEATRAIYLGLSTNMNVFLSGPSGYGKSSLVKFILRFYKIPYGTIVGYKDMSVDSLLGVPDMNMLLKESEYSINFNNSIFSRPGILIGEEFTDILPKTASVLKDILSERGYRHKNGKDESLISSMIVLANKSPVEITEDESTKALYIERFPITAVVKWDAYEIADYMALFNCVMPKEEKKLLYFISSVYANNHLVHQNTVSPRIAIEAAKIYIKKGLEFLKPLDINLEEVEHIQRVAGRDYVNSVISIGLDSLLVYIEEEENVFMKQEKCLYALVKLRNISLDTTQAIKVSEIALEITNIYKTLLTVERRAYVLDIDRILGVL